jgi:tetratricopeptide (TPR) repeat protein
LIDGGINAGAAKPAGPGIDAGLAELFEEFRVAEEGDTVQEDYETHYNMGTAYKEMDLMDEAIQEFQTSVTLVQPGDGTSRFLQCCNMLGHCFIQKGMPDAAVLWFKKGLQAPGHTEDEYQALRYELASAYEQLGDLKRAREFYTEVYGVDVSYREVAEKLSQLRQKQE